MLRKFEKEQKTKQLNMKFMDTRIAISENGLLDMGEKWVGWISYIDKEGGEQ